MFMYYMDIFMGVQFTLFGIFKLIHLWRFASNFAKYDIISSRYRWYGYLYPFIEIIIGVFYFLHYQTFAISIVAGSVSAVTLIGLTRAILRKQQGACVCMGKVVKLKIWRGALIENISMVAMALRMIIAMFPSSQSIPLRMEGESQASIIQHCELMPDMPGCEDILTQ